jgi:hypothetical protein
MKPEAVLVRRRHAAGVNAVAADDLLHGARLVAVGDRYVEIVVGNNLNGIGYATDLGDRRTAQYG